MELTGQFAKFDFTVENNFGNLHIIQNCITTSVTMAVLNRKHSEGLQITQLPVKISCGNKTITIENTSMKIVIISNIETKKSLRDALIKYNLFRSEYPEKNFGSKNPKIVNIV